MLDPYIIGWIASDGHTSKNYWSISQTERNSEVLYKINKHYELGGIIKKQKSYASRYGKEPMYVLTLRNKNHGEYLSKNWGIPTGNKTHSLNFPSNKKNRDIWKYIKGFFEGDGCISSPCNNSLRIGIISCGKWIIKCKTFMKNNGFSPFISYDKRCDDIGSVVLRRRNQIHKFFEKIYENTDVVMESKYNKFCKLLEKFPKIQNERTYLSDEQKKEIFLKLKKGISVSEISKEYKYSKASIWNIKRTITGGRKEVNKRINKKILCLLKKGYTSRKIRFELNCAYKTIKKVKDKHFPSEQKLLEEKDKKIKEYIKQGKRVKEIASKLHCSYCKIARLRKEMINS